MHEATTHVIDNCEASGLIGSKPAMSSVGDAVTRSHPMLRATSGTSVMTIMTEASTADPSTLLDAIVEPLGKNLALIVRDCDQHNFILRFEMMKVGEIPLRKKI
jgi:hypothetical protein